MKQLWKSGNIWARVECLVFLTHNVHMYQRHLTSTGPSSVVRFTRRPAAAIISTDYRLMHHLMCSCVVGLVAGGGRGGGGGAETDRTPGDEWIIGTEPRLKAAAAATKIAGTVAGLRQSRLTATTWYENLICCVLPSANELLSPKRFVHSLRRSDMQDRRQRSQFFSRRPDSGMAQDGRQFFRIFTPTRQVWYGIVEFNVPLDTV